MWTILTRPNCQWCDKAEELLEETYQGDTVIRKFDILSNEYSWAKTLMLKSGMNTVPQVFVENKHIGGYRALEEFLINGPE